jgi:hypothetical protein
MATVHIGKSRRTLHDSVSGITSVVGKKETGQLQLKYFLEIKKVSSRSPIVGRHSNFMYCGFGLEVACCPLVPKFAGSHLAEAVGFLGRKNPQHAFLRRESKAVGPMS